MKRLLMICLFVLIAVSLACNDSKTPKQAKANVENQSSKADRNSANESPRFVEGKPIDKSEVDAIIAKTAPIVQEWVTAAKYVASKSRNEDAQAFTEVLSNNCYARPLMYEGKLASQVVTEPHNKNKAGVCFTLVTDDDLNSMPGLMSGKGVQFAASYGMNGIALNGTSQFRGKNMLLKGLILQHEMAHWAQVNIAGASLVGNAEMEVEAYDFEFGLMDSLGLPNYREFLEREVSRKDLVPNNPYLNDSRINDIFGPTGSETERKMLATILWNRVLFKSYELSNHNVHAKKLAFISDVYKF